MAAAASAGGADANALVRSGMQKFSENDVEGSAADLDAALAARPSIRPYLWQRGLSLYYLRQYEEGAQQFRDDVAVNPNDTEESIWAFLCEAQLLGAEAAAGDEQGHDAFYALLYAVRTQYARQSGDYMAALAVGANPAAGLPEHAGATPLHAAAAAGSAAAVQLLLDAGAPADARDGLQRTPTMLAVLRGHGSTEVVRQLAAAGASMGACCAYGHTPLILAGALGDAPAVDLLLRLGSDPLRTDSKGLTPLAAARRRHAKAVLPDEELAEPEGPGTPGGPDYDAVVRLLEAAEVGRWRSGGEGAGQRGGEAGTA
eukprot:scaffold6.g2746.t1